MTYPHIAAFATRWNDNDVYGHLNNTVYYEAMDTTINVWLMSVACDCLVLTASLLTSLSPACTPPPPC